MLEPPSPEALEAAPHIGRGRYALLSRIGEGGMGGVYAAWDREAEVWRAVKVLLPEHARRKSLRRRFRREAEALMGHAHPHLVEVLEVRDDDDLPFLVMELITGGSLQDWVLKHGPMPARLAAQAARELCIGLAEVHRLGIVHRDVKPQNVLVTRDGVCKLTDFGMARTRESSDTRTGTALGTLGYMAPEQLADSKSVDHRADIFGVGATLYVLLCKATVRDLFRVADDPDRMEGVPSALTDIMVRCLEYEREDRYPDSDALIAALDEALEVLPPLPPDTPPLPRGLRDGPPGASDTFFSEIHPLMDPTEPSTEVPPGRSSMPEPPARSTPVPPPYVAHPEELYDDPSPDLRRPLSDEISVPAAALPVEAEPRRPRHGRTLFVALIAAGLLGGIAAIGALGTVGWGAQHVTRAERAHRDARSALVDAVDEARPLVEELAAAGVPTHDLRDALSALDSAPPDERVQASLGFVDAARDAARSVPASDHHARQLVRQRLGRLDTATDAVQQTWVRWTEHAAHPAGQVAVAIGLADAP